MTIALFPVPTPHHHHLYKLPSLSTYASSFSKLTVPLCSPSSSTSVSVIEEEEEEGPPPSPSPSSAESVCKACGRLEVEKGCNGEGRIQGGIATVPGFGWWPIKAYRPCPGFVASGGRYKRQGQSMDEVVSGGASPQTPPSTATDSKPSTKKEGSKKSKS